MKQKAVTLHEKYYTGTFYASNGWLQKFLKGCCIRFLQIAGEKLSSAPELKAPFKEELTEKITELRLILHMSRVYFGSFCLTKL